MSIRSSFFVSTGMVLLCLAPLARAQAPDCSGISDVSGFDGPTVTDMVGRLTSVRVASGLTDPVLAVSPTGDVDRLFIVEQRGRIKILKNGVVLPKEFLDIQSLTRAPGSGGANEEGLLGLAFHPDYETNGWFFVYYTDSTGNSNVVARYTRSVDPDVAGATTRVEVIRIPHTFADNHNGGMIAFGPQDGYLYIGSGDGGSFCDPSGNGQNLGSRLGKLLRIDVDSLPYSIPQDNPFIGGQPEDDETWSYGLRNPWRWSFDRATAAIYIADVGQGQREEINCRPSSSSGGENYGWDRYEGTVCPNPSCGTQGSCLIDDYVPPVQEYTHSEGCSISGGFVYRGCRMSDLHGHYFYADYCFDIIRSFRTDASCAAPDPISREDDLAPGGGLDISSITSFGEDARGELYVIDRDGELFKILPELTIMELSGSNAEPFSPMVGGGDWTWEDLQATSSHPVTSYKIYRSVGNAADGFDCVHQTAQTSWAGGDPAAPGFGEIFYYLVTALNEAGEETRPGSRSDGTPRVVNSGSACGP